MTHARGISSMSGMSRRARTHVRLLTASQDNPQQDPEGLHRRASRRCESFCERTSACSPPSAQTYVSEEQFNPSEEYKGRGGYTRPDSVIPVPMDESGSDCQWLSDLSEVIIAGRLGLEVLGGQPLSYSEKSNV